MSEKNVGAALEAAFGERELCQPLIAEIQRLAALPGMREQELRLMEVCGTHTVSIFRHGVRSLLPENVRLLSGPGCPVCVTPAGHIDLCVEAAKKPGVILATFGDLIRVPGREASLADARSRGEACIEVVYSPMDALDLARQEPESQVVFPAIGFETTAPTAAATVLAAKACGVKNFSIIPLAKTMPGVLAKLLADAELSLTGLICPGHVSAITGAALFRPIAAQRGLACAVTGFEPADLLAGILSLLRQKAENRYTVENCYTRVVTEEGNRRAQKLMAQVFQPGDSDWRGLGMIPASGLVLRPEFAEFDAVQRFNLQIQPCPEPPGCRCGQILKGKALPPECPLFGRACTPLHPIGPCMVSSEGTCAAYFRYSGQKGSQT